MNIRQSFLLFCALASATLLPHIAWAQGLMDNRITITEVQTDGEGMIVDSWPWLDLGSYYNLTLMQMMQPVATTYIKAPKDNLQYHIVESAPDGRAVREYIVEDEIYSYIYHTYEDRYFGGGQKLIALINSLKAGNQARTTSDKSIVYIYNHNGLSIILEDISDVERLVRQLRALPPRGDHETEALAPLFSDIYDKDKSIHIKWFGNKPEDIFEDTVINGDVVRATNHHTQQWRFFDTIGLRDQTLGQRKLRDYYKSIGITNPVPRFGP
jgi:hypothetical protein